MLVVLTAGAASTDAMTYLGLGKVFPANMTGNTVLLAIGTASGDYAHTIRSVVTLGGFITGAALSGVATGARGTRTWTPALRLVLLVELAVQLAVLGWWLTLPSNPSGAPQLALLGMLGVTMGAQSGAVSRLPVGVSTTYITGTWTAVSTWVAARLRPGVRPERSQDVGLQATVLGCYVAAAFGSGYLYEYAGPVVMVLPVAAVLIVSLTLALRREPPRAS